MQERVRTHARTRARPPARTSTRPPARPPARPHARTHARTQSPSRTSANSTLDVMLRIQPSSADVTARLAHEYREALRRVMGLSVAAAEVFGNLRHTTMHGRIYRCVHVAGMHGHTSTHVRTCACTRVRTRACAQVVTSELIVLPLVGTSVQHCAAANWLAEQRAVATVSVRHHVAFQNRWATSVIQANARTHARPRARARTYARTVAAGGA